VKALLTLVFIDEKRNGVIKARKCAVDSKQWTFPGYVKSEWASPTVSTDGVIITSMIEAHQGRTLAVVDLPNAFLNTFNNEQILMLLKEKLSELIVQIDPKLYRNYIITSAKGDPMLYVRPSKALHGLLQSALLVYRKLRSELEDYGFEVNPCNPCVANEMINGKQMTVTWHIDDLKILHMNSAEVIHCINHFKKIYGDRMAIPHGKVHGYLGMDLDFSTPKVLKIGMIKYVEKVIKELPEQIKSVAATFMLRNIYSTCARKKGQDFT